MYFHVQVDWAFGVNPLIVAYVEKLKISDDQIHVVSENEIIILNNPK